MHLVINGKQIKPRIKPAFIRGNLSEDDFYKFVKNSQYFFEAADWNDRNTKICGKSAYGIWVDTGNAVWAERVGCNKYRVTNNGNHRAYIAHKYRLKILVYIEDDDI